MTSASAPGKIILFGEHAVVYGRPAIAVPLSQLRATARVEDGDQLRLRLPDLLQTFEVSPTPEPNDRRRPLIFALRQVQQLLQIDVLPPLEIEVRSDVPIASGLGSGAATTAATIRALLLHLGAQADDETVSRLTFNVEKLYHGTPSGIDNTVVSYESPVYFQRLPDGNRIEPFKVGRRLQLLVADTGIHSSTKAVVSDVRRQWRKQQQHFEQLFDRCGTLARSARAAIEAGDLEQIGRLMRANHETLQQMSVSSTELDNLVNAADRAGALGAKLSGAGRGGNMIALVDDASCNTVAAALTAAGAVRVLNTQLLFDHK